MMRFLLTHLPNDETADWKFAPEDSIRADNFITPYDASEIHNWCAEQFGPAGARWRIRYGCFMFTRQIDATAFRLAWG